MDVEVKEVPAEIAAPDAGGTASPVTAPISGEVTPVETKEPKTFKQEEVDEIVAKRLAKAQRKWEREAKPPAQVTAPDEGEPKKPLLADYSDEAKFYSFYGPKGFHKWLNARPAQPQPEPPPHPPRVLTEQEKVEVAEGKVKFDKLFSELVDRSKKPKSREPLFAGTPNLSDSVSQPPQEEI